MHFEVSGSGTTPIICVHGWCCDGAQFTELASALGKNFRVYRPDLPGHGRTPLGSFSPTFANYAGAICDFTMKHGLENPILLGHSMGGVLALMAAASEHLRPRAIINLDGSLPPAAHTLAGQAAIRSWLDDLNFLEQLAGALREGFFLPSERDGRCEAIVRTMCSAPKPVLRFLPEQIGTLDGPSILHRIVTPVLYVGAAAPRFDAAGAGTSIARLRLEQIHDAGHFLHIYALPRVVSLVEDFLGSVIER